MYVSAHYIRSIGIDGTVSTDKMVAATDDQDKVWQLPFDSDQGDWRRYLEDGGTVEPFDAATDVPADQRITSAPDRLFFGPTIKEVFHG